SLASKDHIISMIDGKPYKTLRRHLSTNGLTPEQYRERYGLKPDYPMVAEAYSESRRAMAKKIGLGRKPGQKASSAPAATKTRRTPKAASTEAE
ncbi:MAG: transcriptional regulator, partial [Sphingomonas sp.]